MVLVRNISVCLKESLKSENAYAQAETTRLNVKHTQNKAKKDKLLELLISDAISKEDYSAKHSEIEEEQIRIKSQLDSFAKTDTSYTTTLEYAVNLAARSSELFWSSKVEEKRKFINLLLSNCQLKDGKLLFSARIPFNALLKKQGCNVWSG